jgi:hypothetical protein
MIQHWSKVIVYTERRGKRATLYSTKKERMKKNYVKIGLKELCHKTTNITWKERTKFNWNHFYFLRGTKINVTFLNKEYLS